MNDNKINKNISNETHVYYRKNCNNRQKVYYDSKIYYHFLNSKSIPAGNK